MDEFMICVDIGCLCVIVFVLGCFFGVLGRRVDGIGVFIVFVLVGCLSFGFDD